MFKTPRNVKRRKVATPSPSLLDISMSPEFKRNCRRLSDEPAASLPIAHTNDDPSTSGRVEGECEREVEGGGGGESGGDNVNQLDVVSLLSRQHNISVPLCRNICHMLQQEHKVAFIARYRKAQTGNIDADQLRLLADSHRTAIELQQCVARAFKQLSRDLKVTPPIQKALLSVTNKAELETVMEPFKKGPRTTLAARARELGLADAATQLLQGDASSSAVISGRLDDLVRPQMTGRQSVKAVADAMGHVICDVINRDADVQCRVVSLASHHGLTLLSSVRVAKPVRTGAANAKTGAAAAATTAKPPAKDHDKFRNYFAYRRLVRHVKSHEYLAMCRAESKKIVTVKVEVPDCVRHEFTHFCRCKFLNTGHQSEFRTSTVVRCIGEVFSKNVLRAIERQARATLRQRAETDAVRVMARNLSAKLLTPPIRGRTILALDPGYRACKLAVVSAQGQILYTGVIAPQLGRGATGDLRHVTSDPAARQLQTVVAEHQVTLIGIGNGTACTETWRYLLALNQTGWLAGRPLDVTLVDEGGVSEYSATPLAAAEMPHLDCTVRSAVSLARRLQDPISEYVKTDVTSLGVGMYQKDMPAARVAAVLGEAVEQAVAAVGVDINTASVQLLRRVPGLNITRAQSIVDKRVKSGAFVNRSQLKELKGLGPKSFTQCAGFVKVLPATVTTAAKKIDAITPKRKLKSQKNDGRVACSLEPLDTTIIHPESYPLAKQLLKLAGCSERHIGCESVTSRLTAYVTEQSVTSLADRLGSDIYTVELVVSALSHPSDDVRDSLLGPMFFQSLTTAQQLRSGTVWQAVVRNPTDFGVFVDLGVGENGFIHHSQMGAVRSELRVNDRVEVAVLRVVRKQYKTNIELRLIRVVGKQNAP